MLVISNWIARRGLWQHRLLNLSFGMIVALGQPPFSIVSLALVGLFFLATLFAGAATAKAAGWIGWIGGTGYFAVSLHWIVEPFLVDAPRFGWMAPFALLFLATGLALFWAAGFWLAHRIGGRHLWARLLALIVALGLAELARSYILTGFPWGLLGYIWLDTPLAQLAAFVGPHGLGALTMLIVVLPLINPKRLIFASTAVMVLLAALAVGYYRQSSEVAARPEPISLRLVQPNVPQHLKWRPDMMPVFYQRLLDLSQLPRDQPADLIIWPEAAVSFWLDNSPDQQREIAALAGTAGKMILGILRFEGDDAFNSLVVLDQYGQAQAVYDKTHLVPFGEYFPYADRVSQFGLRGLANINGPGLTPGRSTGLIDLGAQGKVLPLICYEAIFPALARSQTRPDWILQITNDAWFGKLAGPYQHLAQARFRAIEQGLPLVRAANTGVSAVIDAKGRLVKTLDLNLSGVVDADVPGSLPQTLYSKSGDLPIGMVLLITLFGIGLIARRK